MLKSMSTTASSVAAIFFAACTSDVFVHQVLGASYDLQVHTCADISKAATVFLNGGVGVKFCTEDQECTTSLLAAPLSNGASITDVFDADSDYTFTLSLGPGVSTMELSITSDDGWCVDQLSLGPTGGTLEQLQTTAVFLDQPCESDEDTYYSGLSCTDSLQNAIAPVVSTTEDLYSLTTTTCDQTLAYSSAIPILSACEIDDCYELLLYEPYGEETPGRSVNGILDSGETVQWLFWLDAPPSELRLSSFGQLGDPDDGWCFAGVTFELPVGGTSLTLSTADTWVDAPCDASYNYEGGCQLEYVFDLTGAALTPAPSTGEALTPAPSAQATDVAITPALTPAPSTQATDVAITPTLTPAPSTQATEVPITPAPTATATDAEEPSPAPSTSSREVTEPMDATSPPTTEEEAMTPAPATTATDNEESPAPSTPSPEAVSAPVTDDTEEDVSDQDTSSAAGRYAPATAWMTSLFIAVIVMLLG